MMKNLFLAMLMAAAALGASAGNPEKLFDEFKKVDNTEYVRVRRAFLWAFRATGMLKDVPAVGNITGIKVLNFDSITPDTKNRFDRRLAEETEGWEEVLRTRDDDGSLVRMFSRTDGKKLHDLYILTSEPGETSFIRLGGTFSTDDLRKLAEKQ